MKSNLVIGSILFLAISGFTNGASANTESPDQGRDVFISRTILGNWEPVHAIQADQKTVVEQAETTHGKSSCKYAHSKRKHEDASQLYTRQFH